MSDYGIPASNILAFPNGGRKSTATTNRLSWRDRMDLLAWQQQAHQLGIDRVALTEDADPEIGDFLLVYARERRWAEWGVGRSAGRFCVWHARSHQTIGHYGTLAEALATLKLAS